MSIILVGLKCLILKFQVSPIRCTTSGVSIFHHLVPILGPNKPKFQLRELVVSSSACTTTHVSLLTCTCSHTEKRQTGTGQYIYRGVSLRHEGFLLYSRTSFFFFFHGRLKLVVNVDIFL